uniref:p-glycoprotein 11.1 n=1 Tax=Toxocara canis TaxID=6265 RepID=A0A891XKB7_TOXCA|nr:P-glycoprotein 11.1 [Toxocara canis]
MDDNRKDSDDENVYEYEQSTLQKAINVLLCRGDSAKEKFEAKPVTFLQLFRFASRNDKFLVAFAILLAFLCGIGLPMMNIIGGRMANVLIIYDKYVGNNEFWNAAYENVVIFAGVGVALGVVSYVQYICFKNASLNITRSTRSTYMKSLLRQDAAWFDTQKAGVITTQLNENIDKIRDGVGDKVGFILRGVTMFFTCVVIGFIYEWRITLVMVALAPLSALLMSFCSRLVDAASSKQMKGNAECTAVLEESIMNFKTIASCNGQETILKKFRDGARTTQKYAAQIAGFSGLFDGIFFFAIYVFFAAGLYYGGYLYKVGVIKEPGDIFIVSNAIVFGGYFLGILSPHIMAITKAKVAAAIIYQTIDRVPSIDSSSKDGIEMIKSEGSIQFSDVHFAYPTRKDKAVFSGLTFSVNAGDTVALVGHSGCGKSTVIGLLTRLYECTAGTVTIDGVDVRKVRTDSLRNIVGVVQQEPMLFSGTIKGNIRLGRADATDDEIVEYCKMANAHCFIENLPEGYNTAIGAGGIQLSGGQKQRIAIARTIARNLRILLFDGATSALDAESEIAVQEALKKASLGRTTVMIAHRLSSLRDTTNIIVISNGKVAEIGSHKELLQKEDGIFANLVKSQQFEEDASEELPMEDEQMGQRPIFKRSTTTTSSTYSGLRSSSYFTQGSVLASEVYSSMRRRSTVQKEIMLDYEDSKQSRRGLWHLYRNCNGNYVKLLAAVVASILRGGEIPLFVVVFKLTFDGFIASNPDMMMQKLRDALIFYIALGVYLLITIFLATLFFGWTGDCVVDSLRCRALSNLLNQDAAYFDIPSRSTAITVTRLSTDAPNIKGALDARMVHIVDNMVALVAALILSVVYCWQVGLLGVGLTAIVFVAVVLLAKFMDKYNGAAIKEDLSGQLSIEIVEQARTIQLLTREEHFCKLFDEKLDHALKLQKRSGPSEAINFAITMALPYAANAVGFGFGISLIYYAHATSDRVFAAGVAISCAGWAVVLLSGCLNSFFGASSSVDSVLRLVYARKLQKDTVGGNEKKELHGNVAFRNVRFCYPSRPEQTILNGLTFHASKGQTIALVGPPGSGKSTVISLLERFYDPSTGIIKPDNYEVKCLPMVELREQIALVGQEPVLFGGTIRENILLGVENKSNEDVIEACEMANARQFIEAMPNAYETEVGERGAQLSGGQKQRIAIARALVGNPKILLLDEATSALDADSEEAVQEALDVAGSGRTCIIVAHRLSSIQHADQIFFIENGTVVEHGTHQQLVEDNGKYAELIRKQDLRS